MFNSFKFHLKQRLLFEFNISAEFTLDKCVRPLPAAGVVRLVITHRGNEGIDADPGTFLF